MQSRFKHWVFLLQQARIHYKFTDFPSTKTSTINKKNKKKKFTTAWSPSINPIFECLFNNTFLRCKCTFYACCVRLSQDAWSTRHAMHGGASNTDAVLNTKNHLLSHKFKLFCVLCSIYPLKELKNWTIPKANGESFTVICPCQYRSR